MDEDQPIQIIKRKGKKITSNKINTPESSDPIGSNEISPQHNRSNELSTTDEASDYYSMSSSRDTRSIVRQNDKCHDQPLHDDSRFSPHYEENKDFHDDISNNRIMEAFTPPMDGVSTDVMLLSPEDHFSPLMFNLGQLGSPPLMHPSPYETHHTRASYELPGFTENHTNTGFRPHDLIIPQDDSGDAEQRLGSSHGDNRLHHGPMTSTPHSTMDMTLQHPGTHHPLTPHSTMDSEFEWNGIVNGLLEEESLSPGQEACRMNQHMASYNQYNSGRNLNNPHQPFYAHEHVYIKNNFNRSGTITPESAPDDHLQYNMNNNNKNNHYNVNYGWIPSQYDNMYNQSYGSSDDIRQDNNHYNNIQSSYKSSQDFNYNNVSQQSSYTESHYNNMDTSYQQQQVQQQYSVPFQHRNFERGIPKSSTPSNAGISDMRTGIHYFRNNLIGSTWTNVTLYPQLLHRPFIYRKPLYTEGRYTKTFRRVVQRQPVRSFENLRKTYDEPDSNETTCDPEFQETSTDISQSCSSPPLEGTLNGTLLAPQKKFIWSDESESLDGFPTGGVSEDIKTRDNEIFEMEQTMQPGRIQSSVNFPKIQNTNKKIVMPECYIWDEAVEKPDARFEILHFRTIKCPYKDECTRKDSGLCDRVHLDSQLRRCPVFSDGKLRYSSVKCANVIDKVEDCPAGNSCAFAHTTLEVAYHPFVYRTKFCPNASCIDVLCAFAHTKEELRNGMQMCGADKAFKTRFCTAYPGPCTKMVCHMAHSREEIQRQLLTEEEESYLKFGHEDSSKLKSFLKYRFKTLHCPYGKVHDWQKCPYAHNIQDIRRNPSLYKYSPKLCQNWDSHSDSHCPLRLDCPHAHGPKESLYHPESLHTKPCTDFLRHGRCNRELRCAYFHSPEESAANTTDTETPQNSQTNNLDILSNTTQSAMEAQVCRLFYHFDEDVDGFLSKKRELRKFVEVIGNSPLRDEEYQGFCEKLERTIQLSNPTLGITMEELQASYRDFGTEIVDRDYDRVFGFGSSIEDGAVFNNQN